MPFELVPRHGPGLERLQEFESERIWVASDSNEVFAYVLSERVLSEEGYEGGNLGKERK